VTDSYCYRRFFGEVYPQQSKAANRMTLENVLRRSRSVSFVFTPGNTLSD